MKSGIQTEKITEEERGRIIVTAAKLIYQEIRDLKCDMNYYPSNGDVSDVHTGTKHLPKSLRLFLTSQYWPEHCVCGLILDRWFQLRYLGLESILNTCMAPAGWLINFTVLDFVSQMRKWCDSNSSFYKSHQHSSTMLWNIICAMVWR